MYKMSHLCNRRPTLVLQEDEYFYKADYLIAWFTFSYQKPGWWFSLKESNLFYKGFSRALPIGSSILTVGNTVAKQGAKIYWSLTIWKSQDDLGHKFNLNFHQEESSSLSRLQSMPVWLT